MAYDLLLRRLVARDVSRGRETPIARDPREVSSARGMIVPAVAGLAATAAVMFLAFGGSRTIRKRAERTYYRATWRDLKSTQETPSQTMRDLVYGPGDE